MTNAEILRIAAAQSAIDSGCSPDDFFRNENVIVISRPHEEARKYLELPYLCDLCSYGSNIVASVSPEVEETVRRFINRFTYYHCFETPNIHVLMNELRPLGYDICFMAEYFLPDVDALRPLECKYDTRVLTAKDFENLYLPEWSNALCEKRRELDMLGVGAYDGDRLIALAGASADCRTMWQIGIDVLPEYRRQGIAAALTGRLAVEILERGIVPFYCCAWSNIASARNAVKAGFRPAWVNVTAKPIKLIESFNS